MVQETIVRQLRTLRLNADKIGAKIIQDVQAGNLTNPVHVFQPSNAAKLGLPPTYMMKFNEAKDPIECSPSGQDVSPDGDHDPNVIKKQISVRLQDEESSVSDLPFSDVDGELPSSLITTRVPKDQANVLSEHQKAINFILQFIDQVSQRDDKISIKMLLR